MHVLPLPISMYVSSIYVARSRCARSHDTTAAAAARRYLRLLVPVLVPVPDCAICRGMGRTI